MAADPLPPFPTAPHAACDFQVDTLPVSRYPKNRQRTYPKHRRTPKMKIFSKMLRHWKWKRRALTRTQVLKRKGF